EVLDRDRDAGEGTLVAGRDLIGLGESPLLTEGDEGVEVSVQALDRLVGALDELAGGHFSAANARRELARRPEHEVVLHSFLSSRIFVGTARAAYRAARAAYREIIAPHGSRTQPGSDP